MFRNVLTAGVTVAALAFAAPILAKPGGGVSVGANVNAGTDMGGPSATGIDARVNSQGSINASPRGVVRSNTNSAIHTNTTTPTVRAPNSQGPLNANTRAISRANSNSVLVRGAVAPTALPGLTTGLTVQNSTGATVGTISQVITGTDGSIRAVVVTSPSGQTLRLAPTTLSISGGIVTTTGG